MFIIMIINIKGIKPVSNFYRNKLAGIKDIC